MRKLLSILSSVTLTSVAATSVVSCSVPTSPISVDFNVNGKDDKVNGTYQINGHDYSINDLNASMNGNFGAVNQVMPAGMSFDQLNSTLLQVVSFDKNLMVKTQKHNQQLRDQRNVFLGRNESQNDLGDKDPVNVASVDGVYIDGVDNDNYYNSFGNTYVNSLNGLKDLYDYQGDTSSATLKESKEQANKLFGKDNKTDMNQFMNDMFHSKKNSAFTGITYDIPGMTEFKSTSQLLTPFYKDSENNELTLGETKDYSENNLNKKEDNTDSKTVNNKSKSDPYGAVVLAPTSESMGKDYSINTDTLKAVKSDTDGKALRSYFMNDSKEISYQNIIKKDGEKITSSIDPNTFGEYFVQKVDGVKVNYHFTSDTKAKENTPARDYTISLTLNNLAEVFTPYITTVDSNQVTNVKMNGTTATVTLNAELKNEASVYLNGESTKIKYANNGNDKKTIIIDNIPNKKDNAISIDSANDGFLKDLSYKFDGTSNAETKVSDNQSNYQLSWLFRGYKFQDWNNIENNKELTKPDQANALVENSNDNGPILSTALSSEINHNLRDLKTTGWEVSLDTPKTPALKNN